jgi:hypothetical protein
MQLLLGDKTEWSRSKPLWFRQITRQDRRGLDLRATFCRHGQFSELSLLIFDMHMDMLGRDLAARRLRECPLFRTRLFDIGIIPLD